MRVVSEPTRKRDLSIKDELPLSERQVSVEEALALIGRRRRVFPNQSFIQQLLWFHQHNNAVDKHTPDYRALKARYSTHAQITEQLP